jgi:hypothetical protein
MSGGPHASYMSARDFLSLVCAEVSANIREFGPRRGCMPFPFYFLFSFFSIFFSKFEFKFKFKLYASSFTIYLCN